MDLQLPSPLQKLTTPLLQQHKLEVWIKRDDLIHPIISGNKWRKLKLNIEACKNQGKSCVVTFGGAFSNHIVATAAACKLNNLKSIGIIRGEEPTSNNHTLQLAKEYGMEMLFISRSDYRQKNEPKFIENLHEKLGDFFLIEEGGANKLGIKGCEAIVTEIQYDFDFIIAACGTATTISGITNALQPHQKAIGIPVLKGASFLNDFIKRQVVKSKQHQFQLFLDYHFGGYAKNNAQLVEFIKNTRKEINIQFDPIYTGKMVYGFLDLVQKQFFPKKSKIILVHTGGLQGITGFNSRYNTNI